MIVEACIQYQSSTAHRDPIHVTAHYLKAVSTAPFEVHIRTLKKGRGFSNVSASLMQKVCNILCYTFEVFWKSESVIHL
jgi:hypothetical protein